MYSADPEHFVDRPSRHSAVVLHIDEAFLLDRRGNATIPDEGGARGVSIVDP